MNSKMQHITQVCCIHDGNVQNSCPANALKDLQACKMAFKKPDVCRSARWPLRIVIHTVRRVAGNAVQLNGNILDALKLRRAV